jgi:hypothetical protein
MLITPNKTILKTKKSTIHTISNYKKELSQLSTSAEAGVGTNGRLDSTSTSPVLIMTILPSVLGANSLSTIWQGREREQRPAGI